jgi:hypothetical protein
MSDNLGASDLWFLSFKKGAKDTLTLIKQS